MTFFSMNAGSTSQKATRFSLATERALPLPWPPTPTMPMFSSELGAVYPGPPSTWRASMAPRPILPASATNSRRVVVLGRAASPSVVLGRAASPSVVLGRAASGDLLLSSKPDILFSVRKRDTRTGPRSLRSRGRLLGFPLSLRDGRHELLDPL